MSDETEERLILESVDGFCRRHLAAEDVASRDREHRPPYDLLPPMADMGLLRAPFAEELGGIDLPWSVVCRIQERLSYSAYFAGSILNRVLCFGIMPLIRFGTPEQRRLLLPPLFEGRSVIALALSEPDVGSDARSVRTRAARDAAGWKLHGRKTWISDAGAASHLLALCRTPDDGERSLTAFLVPAGHPGVAMTELPKVGNNCMPSFDIALDGVELADEFRLGDVGKGFDVVTATLAYSRASMSATVIGCAQAAFDLAATHARERVQFGRPIADFQVIRHRLVDMHMEVVKARLLVRELAARIDRDEAPADLAPMAKIAATEALQFVTDHGMQILASTGYSMDSPMQRYWRDARLYSFGEGTNEIQREIMAKQLKLC